jgi:hypothetical protein
VPTNPGPGFQAFLKLLAANPKLLRAFNLAFADVTGDQITDIILAGGKGNTPFVGVIDGETGQVTRTFLASDPEFRGGVRIMTADVSGDGVADIIAISGVKKGPRIRVFDGDTGDLLFAF